MTQSVRIWIVEKRDFDGLWHSQGVFSTDENAKAFIEAAIADPDLGYDGEDFRIEWEYLDPEYPL